MQAAAVMAAASEGWKGAGAAQLERMHTHLLNRASLGGGGWYLLLLLTDFFAVCGGGCCCCCCSLPAPGAAASGDEDVAAAMVMESVQAAVYARWGCFRRVAASTWTVKMVAMVECWVRRFGTGYFKSCT